MWSIALQQLTTPRCEWECKSLGIIVATRTVSRGRARLKPQHLTKIAKEFCVQPCLRGSSAGQGSTQPHLQDPGLRNHKIRLQGTSSPARQKEGEQISIPAYCCYLFNTFVYYNVFNVLVSKYTYSSMTVHILYYDIHYNGY